MHPSLQDPPTMASQELLTAVSTKPHKENHVEPAAVEKKGGSEDEKKDEKDPEAG